MSNQPWLRQVEVIVGPLQEWQGRGDQANAVVIKGDGTNDQLRVRFDIRKSIMSTPDPCHISIYNLGTAARKSLQGGKQQVVPGSSNKDVLASQTGALVQLRVGWKNVPVQTIYSGTLFAVTSNREGPDIVTTLVCLAGHGSTCRSVASRTWAGGTKLSSIVGALASEFPGITVGRIDIQEYTLGNQGWSFCGMAKDGLDNLARAYGFSWWINDRVFYALNDRQVFQATQAVISHKNGTLLRAEPMVVGNFQKQKGTTIRAILNPVVTAGSKVELESAVNPNLDGSYKVHSVAMTGDTHSSDWDMTIESFFQDEELAKGQKLNTGT